MSVQFQHRRDSNAVIETVTPAAGELGFDTTKNEVLIGDGATLGGIRQSKKNIREILIPAQITANQNDYSPTGLKHAKRLIVSTDASRNVTGIVPTTVAGTTDGRELEIYNGGSFNVVLQDQNAASSAANRFDLGGADVTLSPKQSLTLIYRTQGALNRWEIAARTDGQSPADGSISARKLAASGIPLRAGMINGTIVESHAGSAVTFAIKTLAGNDPSATDPVYAVFQNGSGAYVVRTISAALSLTISSGSSMGVPGNNLPFRLWHLLIDSGAGVVLGAVNCLSGATIMPLHEGLTYSSTAEGGAGAADNAQTIYSAAAQASKYLCIAGYSDYDAGLVATGAWAASPTRTIVWSPGMPKPGESTGNFARQSLSTSATGTTVVPADNTIPQNTEGDQYLSQAITPLSACNVARVSAQLTLAASAGAGTNLTAALFRDSTANALAASTITSSNSGNTYPVQIDHRVAFASALATTFKVRAGNQSAGTVTFNGSGGAQLFGGVLNSFLQIEELMG